MRGAQWHWKLWILFGIFVVFGYVNGEVFSKGNEIGGLADEKSYRFITSPIHALSQCRKHLTFLASIAVGVFATVVLKESPLTPLPLPPIDDHPPLVNLLTLPAHPSFHKWMRRHESQRSDEVASNTWMLQKPSFVGDGAKETVHQLLRFRRHLEREADELSQMLVKEAVSRTLKPLKYLPHLIGMRNFLLKWCH